MPGRRHIPIGGDRELAAFIDEEADGGGGSLPAGGTTGQVLTKESNADGDADWETPGGGSTPGAARVIGPFAFAFDDDGIEDGIEFYTPTVGDILLDAWIEEVTSWNAPALADIGTFDGSTFGFFSAGAGTVDLWGNEDAETQGAGYSLQTAVASSLVGAGASVQARVAPGRFTATNPLLLVVSQEGETGGTPSESTQGEAHVYLVVATPDAPA